MTKSLYLIFVEFFYFVKQLYGKSKNVAATTEASFRPFVGRATTTPSMTFDDESGGNAELCGSNAKIDTIFTGPDNKAYVFKGKGELAYFSRTDMNTILYR